MIRSTKNVMIAGLFVVLSACGNRQDFAYNEKVSNEFLTAMNVFDDYRSGIAKGAYSHLPQEMMASRSNSVDHLIKGADENIADAQQIAHSSNANEFAAGLTDYYTLQKAYYKLVKSYISQPDSNMQRQMLEQINEASGALSDKPDQLLDIQKKFLEKSGIKMK